jgi:pyruvate kinase
MTTGMNIARLNFSHGTHEEHEIVIDRLKKARKELNRPLAIMLDNKGPEIRVGKIPSGKIIVEKGETLLLTDNESKVKGRLPIEPFSALSKIEPKYRILFNDGYIGSEVVEVNSEGILVKIENAGEIIDHKGVNIPGFAIGLPALTERDYQDIKFGCEQNVDIIAASFIRSEEHVLKIKRYLKDLGKSDIIVVSKIENHQGVNNFDNILRVSDGIMVARGDLGVEMPLSQVPRLQKEMIRKCFSAGKPAITATQMLESMIHNPRPTRAEVSDVANAIYDSTSAVMLSGESAVGKYPLQAVGVLKEVIQDTEDYFNFREFFYSHIQKNSNDVPSAITFATVNTAYATGAKAIFVFSSSGYTSRLIAKWRSEIPIIVLTNKRKVYNQLALNWGITPLYSADFDSMKKAFKIVCDYALENDIVALGDVVIVTAGSSFGVSGSTNMMLVENIGDVLLRAKFGYGEPVCDKVSIMASIDEGTLCPMRNKILVITRCDDTYLDFLKEAKGIILENHFDDVESEKYALLVGKTLNIPVIVRADGATTILREDQTITLDPVEFLVYDGTVTLNE